MYRIAELPCMVALLATISHSLLAASPVPLVAEEKGARLSAEDIATISKECLPLGSPWLVEAEVLRFTAPPRIAVKAYLLPQTRTPRLRKGQVLFFFQRLLPDHRPPYAWYRHGEPRNWALVSRPETPFDDGFRVPSGLERPFLADRSISAELVELVDFIRTSPRRPSEPIRSRDEITGERGHPAVDGTCPILSISGLDDGSYVVTTARRRGAGQEVTIRLKKAEFEIVSVAEWAN